MKQEHIGAVLVNRQKLILDGENNSNNNVSRPFYDELVQVLNFLRSGTSDFLRYLEQVNISSSFADGITRHFYQLKNGDADDQSNRRRVHGLHPDGRLVRPVVPNRLGIQSVRRRVLRQGDDAQPLCARQTQAEGDEGRADADDARRQDAHLFVRCGKTVSRRRRGV